MALTAPVLAGLRVKWRSLAELALATARAPDNAQADRLKREANEALNWASALPGYHDAFVLFALARLAAAFAKCPVRQVERRAPALIAVADLVLEMLQEDEPRRLTYRADIDG
jgi:hypothetical protein